MKIGILTQPLQANYGGLLQNFALQQVLITMGHRPVTIDRHFHRPESHVKNVAKSVLRVIKPRYETGFLTTAQRNYLAQHLLRFKKRHILATPVITSQAQFDNEVANGSYDAFIVGSDQCWRPIYSPNIPDYFLNFKTRPGVKKIAYAASFGTDRWEYSPELTELVKPAADALDAISVREESAVDLCREHLGVEAHWVLDPTMILGAKAFSHFILNTQPTGVTTCLLEDSPESRSLVSEVCRLSGINLVTNNLIPPIFRRFEKLSDHVEIPVETWLTNIANASMVVTDSFHGAVFSILFNVPFVVRLNGVRGDTRLRSLLKDFGLEQCLCSDINSITLPEIDWKRVNDHLGKRREMSIAFLSTALSS